jgi:hypothetical protein
MNGAHRAWPSVLAFLFLCINLGSVCSHCLYNAATGWSRMLGSNMPILVVILGVIGIVVAAGNVWAFFIQRLFLGIIIPIIGAIILIDQYFLRPDRRHQFRLAAGAVHRLGDRIDLRLHRRKRVSGTLDRNLGRGGRGHRLLRARHGRPCRGEGAHHRVILLSNPRRAGQTASLPLKADWHHHESRLRNL